MANVGVWLHTLLDTGYWLPSQSGKCCHVMCSACMDVSTRVGVSLPSLDEYQQGATSAILRLQRTYALETTEVADGLIRGVPAAVRLGRDDCYLFGTAALKQGDYGLAAQWLTLAVRDGPVDSLPWVDAVTRLIEAHQQVRPIYSIQVQFKNTYSNIFNKIN